MKQKKAAGLLTLILFICTPFTAIAETVAPESITIDEDSLFGEAAEETLVEEVTPTGNKIESILLTTDGVELGGRYSFSASSLWTWSDPASFFENIVEPDSGLARINLGASLFFDARPSEDTRVFGKISTSYPFTDAVHVDELFSDFNWRDTLFFRGGKHTINWGVGYFFSPADLLNITEINPENPDAEREGPISVKIHFPVSIHNFYFYTIANNITAIDEIGLAAKAEFVLGPFELGLGGFYQKDAAPSGMLTFSGALWDIDFFGETVLRYGSDMKYLVESETAPLGIEVVEYDDKFFYNATAGFSFMYTGENSDSSFNLSGQYLYNGEGHEDPAFIQDNSTSVNELLGSGSISFTDLISRGRHYSAANAGWRSIFGSDFTLQAFWMHNFSDMSGVANATLSINLFDRVAISLRPGYNYGETGSEYGRNGSDLSVQLNASIGNSGF
jgi:hypothetical protein